MPARRHREPWFRMTVNFPKYVTVNNARLAFFFYVTVVVTFLVALYQFVVNRRYVVQRLPEGEVSVCSQMCQPSLSAATSRMSSASTAFCANSGFDWGDYSNIGCSQLCRPGIGAGTSCLSLYDVLQVTPSTAFVPTFYEEVNSADPSSTAGCTFGHSRVDGVCVKSGAYFVPGVEDTTIEFSHSFKVERPESTILGERADETGSSWTDLDTVILKKDGSIMKEVLAGNRINITVSEILQHAEVMELGSSDASLALDDQYTRPEADVLADASGVQPTLRMTGLEVTIDVFYTNERTCMVDLDHKVSVSQNRVACVIMRARRQWTMVESTSLISTTGSSSWRRYHGIMVKFHIDGDFKFLDYSQFFRGLTTIVIWMQIPTWILYYFSCFMIGILSQIYSRVIHQPMSLSDACVGLAARLISHSSSFSCVQDKVEGITKSRLLDRFLMIMQFSGHLDETEVRKLVDFVYEGATSKSLKPKISQVAGHDAEVGEQPIDMQAFCSTCSGNESLTLDSLVNIFDTNRRLGVHESLFSDVILSKVHSPTALQDAQEIVARAQVRSGSAVSEEKAADVKDGVNIEQYCKVLAEDVRAAVDACGRLLDKEEQLRARAAELEIEVKRLGGKAD